MKALVVYFSRTGTTKKVASAIAKILKCDMDEITEPKSRKGIAGYLRSGKESMKKIIPSINPAKKNPASYDILIIGTPIWGWTVSSPVRAYLSQNKDKIKKTAYFCTMGGSGSKNAFQEMEIICSKKPVATLELTTAEVNKQDYTDKLKKFMDKLR